MQYLLTNSPVTFEVEYYVLSSQIILLCVQYHSQFLILVVLVFFSYWLLRFLPFVVLLFNYSVRHEVFSAGVLRCVNYYQNILYPCL